MDNGSNPGSGQMSPDRRLTLAVALVLISVAARLYLFAPERNFSPDSVDYLNIARNLAQGRGFVHSIKWHFFTDHPVAHSAVAERPPLYPLVVSVVWRLGGRLVAINLLNVALGVLAVALLFLLYEKVLDSTALAFAAGLLVALNPSVAKGCVFPWTESLFLVLQTTALLLVVAGIPTGSEKGCDSSRGGGGRRRQDYSFVLAGVAAALAYLVRPNALAMVGAVAFALALRRLWRSLVFFLLPCLLLLAVWFEAVWLVHGSPLYSVQGHHARVLNIRDGMSAGWGAEISTAAEFARDNPIGTLVIRNAGLYGLEFLGRPFLGLPVGVAAAGVQSMPVGALGTLILLALALGGLAGWRARLRGADLLTFCGLLYFALISVVWATHEGDRLLQPVFVCLAPLWALAAFSAVRWTVLRRSPRQARLVAGGAVFALCLAVSGLYIHDLRATRAALMQRPRLPAPSAEQRARVGAVLPPGVVVATDEPFVCNWLIDRPTIQLPDRLDASNAALFFGQFDISLIAVANPRRANLGERLRPILQQGAIRPIAPNFGFGFTWFFVRETGRPSPPEGPDATAGTAAPPPPQ